MARSRPEAALFVAAVLLAGCSYVSDAIFPSLTGEDPAPATQTNDDRANDTRANDTRADAAGPAEAARPEPAVPLSMGDSRFVAPGISPGNATGTEVGRKVAQLRAEAIRLQDAITQHNAGLQQARSETMRRAQTYHGTVAAINARLQVGTTPGNPILVSQWNTAQEQLDLVSRGIGAMNTLANRVAGDSTTASYILETTRATFGLSGALDEDHRQLSTLEDEVNRTVVMIDRLLNDLAEDINRQSIYVGNERKNLTTLSVAIKNGEILGHSLANRAFEPGPFQPRPGTGAAANDTRRPLVVIRFDSRNVEYEQALYTAVSHALERRPEAGFDVVAVAPAEGTTPALAATSNAARRHAETVLRSLTAMGLPAGRVNLSAASSAEAHGAEVHVYVR